MTRHRSLIALPTILCVLTSAPAMPQAAAPDAAPLGQTPAPVQPPPQATQLPLHIVVQGIPGAAHCPAPDWIKPGTRLAFLSASATVQDAAGAVTLVPDPNGNIKDAQGNRYKEKGAATAASSGAGYMIVDVVASEPGVLVLTTGMFTLLNGTQGPAMLSSTWGDAIHPSGCDWFLHPKLIGQMQPIDANGISIFRHSMEHNVGGGGGNYNCVRVTVTSAGRTSYVYDVSSGVLLSHNGSAGFNKGIVHQRTGDTYNPVQSTGQSLVMNRFISARETGVPWKNQQMPAWARTMKKARYQGAVTMKGPPNSGVFETSFGMTAEVTTSYVGRTFTVYQMSVTQETVGGLPPNPPATSVLVSGPASIAGFWMDPNALRQLQTGQALDSDPTVGIQTTVEYVGQGQGGRPIVVITCASQVNKTSSTYDASDGRLIAVSKTDFYPETGFSNVTNLQLVGME